MKKAASEQSALKRVLIIHTDGNTFNNPTLKCIIDLLLAKGCEIDLRYPKSDAPMPCYPGVRFLPFGGRINGWKSLVFSQYGFRPLMFLFVLAEKIIYYRKYDLTLGVDRQGLLEANILNKITKTPYVYLSFEIMFEEETSARYKLLEREAARNVAFWLIQDEERAGQLQRENFLGAFNKVLLPLASAGVGTVETTRLRDRLRIPEDKKVAILIGSVGKWTMTGQILKCVADWSDDWVLVVHARYGRTRELLENELPEFVDLLGRKIFISDAATELVDDMGGILAGISAGLAFYQPVYGQCNYGFYTGKNLKHLGLASGKISTLLRYGVPVVINEIGLYADEARRFQFGCVVGQPEQIKDCLDEISHEKYRHNATDYFASKLDFNIYRDNIWSRFESLVDKTRRAPASS